MKGLWYFTYETLNPLILVLSELKQKSIQKTWGEKGSHRNRVIFPKLWSFPPPGILSRVLIQRSFNKIFLPCLALILCLYENYRNVPVQIYDLCASNFTLHLCFYLQYRHWSNCVLPSFLRKERFWEKIRAIKAFQAQLIIILCQEMYILYKLDIKNSVSIMNSWKYH